MHKIKNYGKRLNEFYATGLGNIACWFIRRKLLEINIRENEKILCYGFTQPYADLFESAKANLTPFRTSFSGEVISEYDKLPLRDAQFDRVIAIHAIDHHDFPEQVIAEFWRVLEPEGKLILLAVNQNGFWKKTICNKDAGATTSYIKEALSFNKFFTTKIHNCLNFPPVQFFSALRIFNFLGRVICPSKSGVLIFEAEKKVFAPKGRLLKITPSLKDLIFRPKKVANSKDIA